MTVNSSFSSNASLPLSTLSSSSDMYIFMLNCFKSTVGTFTVTAFMIIVVVLLLPLCIIVLFLGLQRWRQQRSNTTMSHSDLLTYNMVIIELMGVLGSTLLCWSLHADLPLMTSVSLYFSAVNLTGQMFFHLLTCVDRYLAVVHPITYLSLRKEKLIRIRNITVACVWPLSFVLTGLVCFVHNVPSIAMLFVCVTSFIVTVVTFCSLSILCVLGHPGPGERGGARRLVDQSKLRAFYTIMAILVVLLLRFGAYIISNTLYNSQQYRESDKCALWLSVVWFGLPSSLVLPLLFLQKARKLHC